MAAPLEEPDRRTTALEHTQTETAQTLRWVVASLGRMHAVQEDHTLRLERIETTQGDHTRRLDRLETRLGNVEGRVGTLEAKVDALPRAIAELIEASEKRLLAAIAKG